MNSEQNRKSQGILTSAHRDFEKGLNAYAFFKVSDHAIGEDLVQDTFMKTWKYLVKGGEISTMKAFLYHVLNNLIVDQYRKHKTASLDVMVEKGFDQSEAAPERALNILDGKSAQLLIQRLPETYRKVMHLRYVKDLSLEEMSLITGKTKNSIAVQIHRGLEKLKLLQISKKI
ncbi:MAG: RNA polymerase sigma factor [Patescibacteria group bacterium]